MERELAKPAYADQRSWVQRLWDWAMDRLHDLLNNVGSALPLYTLIPLLLVLVAVIVFGMTRIRHRVVSARTAKTPGVLTDVELTGDQLRSRATGLAAEGAHSAAFVDIFRAIARRAEERALLVPRPGRTAHEVGAELAAYFPEQQAGIAQAAAYFDGVRYGDTTADADDVARIRTLDQTLETARPQHFSSMQVHG
jgi:hypothetical protein